MNEEGYEMKKLSVVILCMLICIQITHAYAALEFTVEPCNDDYYTDTVEADGGKRGRVWNMDSIEYGRPDAMHPVFLLPCTLCHI